LTSDETPVWKTGTLWGVLAVFLIVGAVGCATVAYGVAGLLAGDPWFGLAVPVGTVIAGLAFLFMAGILYRVDRYRGANDRRVELFE
jgi:hypothetical protein